MDAIYHYIADDHGTPVHVFDSGILLENLNHFTAAWRHSPVPMEVLYSIKTNYMPRILGLVRDNVWGADAVSGYEVRAALRAGYAPHSISFNGPMKTADEIHEAVKAGVTINIDGPAEIDAIESAGAEKVDVGLRLNPETNVYASPDPTFEANAEKKAKKAKFGWPIGCQGLATLLDRLERSPVIRLSRIHVHLGSQITDPDLLVAAIDRTFAFTRSLKERFPIEKLNIGGGFGVSTLFRSRRGPLYDLASHIGLDMPPHTSRGLDLPDLAKRVGTLIEKYSLDDITLQSEPGRYLVSNAMSLLTRVVSVKDLGPGYGTWVVVDGGLNLIPTGGPQESRRYELLSGAGNTAEANEPVTVMLGGPLCYEGDVFGYDIELPRMPVPGDLLRIHDTGAYTVSRSTNFIRPRAGVVEIDKANGAYIPCWRPESDDDIFSFSLHDNFCA